MRTTANIARHIYHPFLREIPAPEFTGRNSRNIHQVGLAVKSMERHTTDEGWQLFQGLQSAGYALAGMGITMELDWQAFGETWSYQNHTDVKEILDLALPTTVVLQDKREWIGKTAGKGFDPLETFTNVSSLREHPEVFKVGVLKDAHSDAHLHIDSANEAGLHAWVVYYHPTIVAAQAPYVRPKHLIRTYHSIDEDLVPPFSQRRSQSVGLLSGAVSGAYPLRSRLALACENQSMRHLTYRKHPGYRRDGCHTPEYLKLLSTYRVAVCTSSRWGYAVRKIIEATAAGCIVVTDLPKDEVLPCIDGNLIRVETDINSRELDELVGDLCERYDAGMQQSWSTLAQTWYDFRAVGKRLADDIEKLRVSY